MSMPVVRLPGSHLAASYHSWIEKMMLSAMWAMKETPTAISTAATWLRTSMPKPKPSSVHTMKASTPMPRDFQTSGSLSSVSTCLAAVSTSAPPPTLATEWTTA